MIGRFSCASSPRGKQSDAQRRSHDDFSFVSQAQWQLERCAVDASPETSPSRVTPTSPKARLLSWRRRSGRRNRTPPRAPTPRNPPSVRRPCRRPMRAKAAKPQPACRPIRSRLSREIPLSKLPTEYCISSKKSTLIVQLSNSPSTSSVCKTSFRKVVFLFDLACVLIEGLSLVVCLILSLIGSALSRLCFSC